MRIALLSLMTLTTFGCAMAPKDLPVIASTKSPLELRAMQSRQFDTHDRSKTVRTVIAALQDLGYNIDKVDASSGTVTATKLAVLRLSAAVAPRGVIAHPPFVQSFLDTVTAGSIHDGAWTEQPLSPFPAMT